MKRARESEIDAQLCLKLCEMHELKELNASSNTTDVASGADCRSVAEI